MITEEQRQLRKKYIGSSDASAVMGVDPYRSKADVWLEKTGRVDDFDGNDATERGNLLEPVLVDWAERKLGAWMSIHDAMLVDAGGILAANFDGLTDSFIIEAKTTVNSDEWGEAGTDEVPERVIVQTHHAMRVAGPQCRVAHVPVLMPGFKSLDFKMYKVERNDQLADAIADEITRFWNHYVKLDIQPDDFKPSIEVLKRMRRMPGKISVIDRALVEAWERAKLEWKAAEEVKEMAQTALIAALGDAEGGDFGGEKILTYMETARKGFTGEPTTFRSLRLKKKDK